MEKFNEVLKENRTRLQRNRIKREQELKRQQIKEWILFLLIAAFILCMCFSALIKMDQKSMNNCINKGYDKLICERNL